MPAVSYVCGSATSVQLLGLEKTALPWGAIATAGKELGGKLLRSRSGALAGRALKYLPGQKAKFVEGVGRRLAPFGQKMEQGVQAAGQYLGGDAGRQLATRTIKGVPGTMARDAVGWAGFSGVLEGGMAAAGAKPGDRTDAFLHGAAHGALTGAAMGTLAGGARGMMNNTRRGMLENLARSKGLTGQAATAAAEQQMSRSWKGSLVDAVRGKGPGGAPLTLGRHGAAQKAIGGTATMIGADFLAPGLVGGGEETPPAQTRPAAPVRPPIRPAVPVQPQAPHPTPYQTRYASDSSAPLLGSMLGSAAIGVPVSVLLESAGRAGHLPGGWKGSLVANAARVAAGAAGAYGGYRVGKTIAHDPAQENIDAKLDQIDFDKLMRYYKKRESTRR